MLKIEGSLGNRQIFRLKGLAGSGPGTDGLGATLEREGEAALTFANS